MKTKTMIFRRREDDGSIVNVERVFTQEPPTEVLPKAYCSTPGWLPKKFRDSVERKNGDICKLHDNERGIRGTIPAIEAHKHFYELLRFRRNSWLLSKIAFLWLKWKDAKDDAHGAKVEPK